MLGEEVVERSSNLKRFFFGGGGADCVEAGLGLVARYPAFERFSIVFAYVANNAVPIGLSSSDDLDVGVESTDVEVGWRTPELGGEGDDAVEVGATVLVTLLGEQHVNNIREAIEMGE